MEYENEKIEYENVLMEIKSEKVVKKPHHVINQESENEKMVKKPEEEPQEDEKVDKKPQHVIPIADCPISRVTVYPSQAMLLRQAKVKFTSTGEQQVIFDNMSSSTVSDSVRISGLGHCQVVGVVYKNEKVKKQRKAQMKKQVEAIEEQKKKFSTELAQIVEKEEALARARTRVQKDGNFIESYASVVLNVSKDDRHIAQLVQPDTLSSISDFMAFHTKERERIQAAIEQLDKEGAILSEQKGKVTTEIHKLDEEISKARNNYEWRNRAVITIDVNKADTEAEFTLQYIVTNASWTSSFDARIDSGATVDQKSTFKLTYYGIIRQNTGEPWNDCNVSLSTADTNRRSVEPPTLPKQYVNIATHYGHFTKRRGNFSVSQQRQNDELSEDANISDDEDMDGEDQNTSTPDMGVQQTTAEAGTTSSIFHIPRSATIPSDDAPHKVTITIIDLDSKLSHYSVPKLDTNAYIKVKTRNNSEFQLLPGDMNVFVDGSFVARGKMQNVNVGETFKNFLGVDPSIKIDYKAPHRLSEVSGVISRYRKVTVTRRFTVKNTKNVAVDIMLRDQVPKSQDNDIKVELLFPALQNRNITTLSNATLVEKPAPNTPVRVENKIVWKKEENHMEWSLKIPPSVEVGVDLRYSVVWPDSASLDQESL